MQSNNTKVTRRQLAVEAISGGATQAKVATQFGVSRSTVQRWCSAAGVSVMPRFSESDRATVLRAVLSGETAGSIAKRFGCHVNTVHAWVQRGKINSSVAYALNHLSRLTHDEFDGVVLVERKRRGLVSP